MRRVVLARCQGDGLLRQIVILYNATFAGLRLDVPGVMVYVHEDVAADGGTGDRSWHAQATFVPAGPQAPSIPGSGELSGTVADGAKISGMATAAMVVTAHGSTVMMAIDLTGEGELAGLTPLPPPDHG